MRGTSRSCSTSQSRTRGCRCEAVYLRFANKPYASAISIFLFVTQTPTMQDELSKVNAKIKTGSEKIDKNSMDVDKLKVISTTPQASPV